MTNSLSPSLLLASLLVLDISSALAQTGMPDITQQQSYVQHRASSYSPVGGNKGSRTITPGEALTILDVDGPGAISHLWFTISDPEPYHLKRIVMRIYWDGEESPSVETPVGDFHRLGLGAYVSWQSQMLSVGSNKALNSFFPMPYRKHARITITNDGKESLPSFYYNIDYRTEAHPLPASTLYLHAQYRQPNQTMAGPVSGMKTAILSWFISAI